MPMDAVRCGDVSLNVLDTGPGERVPAVLFVNAVGMAADLVEPFARLVHLAGFRFITWELRGSPGPSDGVGDCTLTAHARDGAAILTALGVRDVHLAGWCTGASVALFLARDLGARIRSLTSVDGSYLFDGVPGAPLGNAMYAMCGEIVADPATGPRYHELTRPRGTEAAVLGLAGRPDLVDHMTLPYRQGVEELIRYAHAIRAACDYDPVRLCSTVECPTLVTARRDDRMVSYRNSRRAADLIPGARVTLADHGGHYGLFVDAEAMAREITGFLRHAEAAA
jgi:pimeloyl-ACP methyl ester carboxylesterase